MKTAMASTSLAAYDDLKSTGKLTKRQQQVMAVIRPGRDYSLSELVMFSKLPINTVSGRVVELKSKDLNQLELGPKRKCSITGFSVHPVRIKAKQVELFDEVAV